ncbi:MAG: hypothetical protein M1822_003479 [Bathelium mastoideum]|nr:MAG: hypothetical protein M1822_003479 [Bathelium mastoideum]
MATAMFKSNKGRKPSEVPCIFVHAGAGFHSVQNEHVHLRACEDSARAAMAMLRAGSSAMDAVEMAVKILEDREITNAGYGSNLSIDGTVECDASVVDHLGRSGGAGAVPEVKNPISLARLIYEHSTKELTLRRVPPNLLVGQGATEFAFENGMPTLPPDALVSPAARERWVRWKQDLEAVEKKIRYESKKKSRTSTSPTPITNASEYSSISDRTAIPQDHHNSKSHRSSSPIPDNLHQMSPPPTSDNLKGLGSVSSDYTTAESSPTSSPRPQSGAADMEDFSDPRGPPISIYRHASRCALINSTESVLDQQVVAADGLAHWYEHIGNESSDADDPELHGGDYGGDGSSLSSHSSKSRSTLRLPSLTPSPPTSERRASVVPPEALKLPLPETPPEKNVESPSPRACTPLKCMRNKGSPPLPPLPKAPSPLARHPQAGHHTDGQDDDPLCDHHELPPPADVENDDDKHSTRADDQITDTVGAIAIDAAGNIACGASSGGIGMKHRGRIGPAALVGVGAAVVPSDPADKERTTVAAVTSGTGEHMATTMAATLCAERLYQGVRKVKGGGFEQAGDDEVLRAMIETDFMGRLIGSFFLKNN